MSGKSVIISSSILGLIFNASFFQPIKASPQFKVTTASPGAIDFTGSGTAQFNNSVGTNNSFQVGSSTNLGVNASISSAGESTSVEFVAAAVAKLDLSGTTTLKQVIGTSGASNSTASTATAAHDVARSVMSSRDIGVSWDRDKTYANGRTYSSAAEWKVDYDAEYNTEYQNAHSNIRTSESSQQNSGTISGKFNTKETGAGTSGGSMADWSANADLSAQTKYGSSYENRGSTYSSMGTSEWQAAYDAEYNKAYGSAAAGAARTSDSEVTVNGIGSDASVTAATTSTFDVKITQNSGDSYGSTATANGSAGASLATSSFANQSQASTASGFMQAFGGGM